MPEDLAWDQKDRRAPRLEIEPEAFARLREFSAGGYVPVHADPEEGGILLRHASAPDIILRSDGTIDLPLGQVPKARVDAVTGTQTGRLWRIGLIFLIVSGLLSFVSVFLATIALDALGRP